MSKVGKPWARLDGRCTPCLPLLTLQALCTAWGGDVVGLTTRECKMCRGSLGVDMIRTWVRRGGAVTDLMYRILEQPGWPAAAANLAAPASSLPAPKPCRWRPAWARRATPRPSPRSQWTTSRRRCTSEKEPGFGRHGVRQCTRECTRQRYPDGASACCGWKCGGWRGSTGGSPGEGAARVCCTRTHAWSVVVRCIPVPPPWGHCYCLSSSPSVLLQLLRPRCSLTGPCLAPRLTCNVQVWLPEPRLGGDVQRPHRAPAAGPNLPQPHLLPTPEAHGGRQDPLEVGARIPIVLYWSYDRFQCLPPQAMRDALRVSAPANPARVAPDLRGLPLPGCVAAGGACVVGVRVPPWLPPGCRAHAQSSPHSAHVLLAGRHGLTLHTPLPPEKAIKEISIPLQRPGTGADPDAAASGGPRARRRPALWRDGARLHHLARRRSLPQGK